MEILNNIGRAEAYKNTKIDELMAEFEFEELDFSAENMIKDIWATLKNAQDPNNLHDVLPAPMQRSLKNHIADRDTQNRFLASVYVSVQEYDQIVHGEVSTEPNTNPPIKWGDGRIKFGENQSDELREENKPRISWGQPSATPTVSAEQRPTIADPESTESGRQLINEVKQLGEQIIANYPVITNDNFESFAKELADFQKKCNAIQPLSPETKTQDYDDLLIISKLWNPVRAFITTDGNNTEEIMDASSHKLTQLERYLESQKNKIDAQKLLRTKIILG